MLNEDTHLVRDVKPGKTKQFDLHIAKLPTGTVINIHVFVYRGKKPGPVLLLTGGLHGDEVNGVEIIRRLMKNNLLMPDAGTVIAIPILNIYGFLNFARDLPDGKDANRSFPGTKNGSLASRMAYNIQKHILPIIDYGLDFHTGGSNRSNYPQIRCDFTDETSLQLAYQFAPPFIINSPLIPASLRNEAKQQGKPIIVYEAGQSLRFDTHAIEEGIKGTLRLMKALKMTPRAIVSPQHEEVLQLHKTSWLRAEEAGLFNAEVIEGAYVENGQLLGTLSDPYVEKEVAIYANQNAFVIGLNHAPIVNAGDALVHLGSTDAKK